VHGFVNTVSLRKTFDSGSSTAVDGDAVFWVLVLSQIRAHKALWSLQNTSHKKALDDNRQGLFLWDIGGIDIL
jgi:hypothetical protein